MSCRFTVLSSASAFRGHQFYEFQEVEGRWQWISLVIFLCASQRVQDLDLTVLDGKFSVSRHWLENHAVWRSRSDTCSMSLSRCMSRRLFICSRREEVVTVCRRWFSKLSTLSSCIRGFRLCCPSSFLDTYQIFWRRLQFAWRRQIFGFESWSYDLSFTDLHEKRTWIYRYLILVLSTIWVLRLNVVIGDVFSFGSDKLVLFNSWFLGRFTLDDSTISVTMEHCVWTLSRSPEHDLWNVASFIMGIDFEHRCITVCDKSEDFKFKDFPWEHVAGRNEWLRATADRPGIVMESRA